jgi:hypothetical protein
MVVLVLAVVCFCAEGSAKEPGGGLNLTIHSLVASKVHRKTEKKFIGLPKISRHRPSIESPVLNASIVLCNLVRSRDNKHGVVVVCMEKNNADVFESASCVLRVITVDHASIL